MGQHGEEVSDMRYHGVSILTGQGNSSVTQVEEKALDMGTRMLDYNMIKSVIWC